MQPAPVIVTNALKFIFGVLVLCVGIILYSPASFYFLLTKLKAVFLILVPCATSAYLNLTHGTYVY